MITKKTIKMLEGSMLGNTRDNGDEYFYFSDTVDENLRELYIKNYSISDLDYEIFNCAINTITEAYMYFNNKINKDSKQDFIEYIQENYNEHASIMTYDRLQYLNNYNDDEVAKIIDECDLASVSQACAFWYDEQVNNAISLILDLYE